MTEWIYGKETIVLMKAKLRTSKEVLGELAKTQGHRSIFRIGGGGGDKSKKKIKIRRVAKFKFLYV